MDPLSNAFLGIAFLFVAALATLLMYHLWGYKFNHETLKSEAPKRWMFVHRALGWIYFAMYAVFMWQMLPRLWAYQIEFPARTVMHLTLGLAIGAVLVVKVVIVRFFKHLEGTLAPFLGTALLICTVLLIGLSAPFALRQAYVHAGEAGVSEAAGLERVREHLGVAGLEDARQIDDLASTAGLQAGRAVLFTNCIECHDLRTVLARPRTPQDWRLTVRRMADRSTLLAPITEAQQWQVTAYLIAISPDLQKAGVERRRQRQDEQHTQEAIDQMESPREAPSAESPSFDSAAAAQLFETQCALCHPLEMVDAAPPTTHEESIAVVKRMVSNGMVLDEEQIRLIVGVLDRRYVED